MCISGNPCWRCLLGLAVERERQRIGKGRLDGLGVELPWVWLACHGCDWGGAGRKVMAEFSWKGKRENQSRVGNGFMTFFFLRFWFYCFMFYYYFFNVMLTWKIVGVSKDSVLYIYIDEYISHSTTHFLPPTSQVNFFGQICLLIFAYRCC